MTQDDLSVLNVEDKTIMRIGDSLFELCVGRTGRPELLKLSIWSKYTPPDALFVKKIDNTRVVISRRGHDVVVMDSDVFYSHVAPILGDPQTIVSFDPGLNDIPAYDGGVDIDEAPECAQVCPECSVSLVGRETDVCEVCGKRMCSNCIIRSRINKFEQNLCPDCYYQKKSAAGILLGGDGQ